MKLIIRTVDNNTFNFETHEHNKVESFVNAQKGNWMSLNGEVVIQLDKIVSINVDNSQ